MAWLHLRPKQRSSGVKTKKQAFAASYQDAVTGPTAKDPVARNRAQSLARESRDTLCVDPHVVLCSSMLSAVGIASDSPLTQHSNLGEFVCLRSNGSRDTVNLQS